MIMFDRKIYGLIGYPLTHSFSQEYFNRKFESEGINAIYMNFEIPDIGDLMEVVAEYPALAGLNVTIPYKEQVLPYLDKIDPIAKEIGAVNVIKIEHAPNNDMKFIGFNSDVVGFGDSIAPLLTPERKGALILGTGGASKACHKALRDLGVSCLKVSRTPHGEGQIGYSDITPEIMSSHRIIVNTTPLGMFPKVLECPDIPYDLLDSSYLCYDLLYNPNETLFMRKAKEHGAEVKNGLEMLLLQAFVSWNYWNS